MVQLSEAFADSPAKGQAALCKREGRGPNRHPKWSIIQQKPKYTGQACLQNISPKEITEAKKLPKDITCSLIYSGKTGCKLKCLQQSGGEDVNEEGRPGE